MLKRFSGGLEHVWAKVDADEVSEGMRKRGQATHQSRYSRYVPAFPLLYHGTSSVSTSRWYRHYLEGLCPGRAFSGGKCG
jgi:hypothetical protein